MPVVHCKKTKFDVYIGRPSKWGNPYSWLPSTPEEFKVETREDAITAYLLWVVNQSELMDALPEIRGKTLGCWCAPKPCHGDTLLKLAEWQHHRLPVKTPFSKP